MTAWELATLVRRAILRITAAKMRERTGPTAYNPVPEIMAKVPGGSWDA